MKRGYPRPQMRVEKISADVDKERWGNRSYPIPYSARTNLISRIHYGRTIECITYRKCLVCGTVVDLDDDGKVIVLLDRGMIGVESGPFHEKCARLTARLCPVVARDIERRTAEEIKLTRFGFSTHDWKQARETMKRKFHEMYKAKEDEPNT